MYSNGGNGGRYTDGSAGVSNSGNGGAGGQSSGGGEKYGKNGGSGIVIVRWGGYSE